MSFLIAWWHSIHRSAWGIDARALLSTETWQSTHFEPAATCALWLNGTGCGATALGKRSSGALVLRRLAGQAGAHRNQKEIPHHGREYTISFPVNAESYLFPPPAAMPTNCLRVFFPM